MELEVLLVIATLVTIVSVSARDPAYIETGTPTSVLPSTASRVDDQELESRSGKTYKCVHGQELVVNLAKGQDIFWENPFFPHSDVDTLDCVLVVRRKDKWPKVCQLKVTFLNFSLAQPECGSCNVDTFTAQIGSQDESIALCGHELEDFVDSDDGRVASYYDRFYEYADNEDEIRFRITTRNKMYTRRWRLRLQNIDCKSIEAAPSGCHRYFVDYGSPIVIRSLNYPFSMKTSYFSNVTTMICFGVQNASEPIRFVTLKPSSGHFDARPFKLGSRRGPWHDEHCTAENTRLITNRGPGPQRSAYCGDRFNSKAGTDRDRTVRLESNNFNRFLIVATEQAVSGGYRFLAMINDLSDSGEVYKDPVPSNFELAPPGNGDGQSSFELPPAGNGDETSNGVVRHERT